MWTEAFLEYLTLERNYSLRTVEEYRDDLNAFESYYKKVDSTLSWETIDGDVVRDWMVSMMEAGRTATTVNRRLSALRTFYRYLLKRDWIKADPVRNIQGPKKKKPLPVFLKESEMDRLLDGEFFDSDFLGKRDKLIVNTFYVTGDVCGRKGRAAYKCKGAESCAALFRNGDYTEEKESARVTAYFCNLDAEPSCRFRIFKRVVGA